MTKKAKNPPKQAKSKKKGTSGLAMVAKRKAKGSKVLKPNKTGSKHANSTSWKPGQCPNPRGRPIGTKERDYMLEAKLAVEKEEKISIYTHAFRRAFKDDRVLIAMLKKLVPDMAYIESDAAQSLADIFALVMGKK